MADKYDEQIQQISEDVKKRDKALEEIQLTLKGKLNAEELKAVSDRLDAVKDSLTAIEQVEGKSLPEYVKATQEHADALEKELKEIKAGMKIKELTLPDKVKSLVLSDDFQAHLKGMKKSGLPITGFEIEKAANDLLTSDWTADTGAVGLPQMQLPGVTKHPWKNAPIFSAVAKRTMGMGHQVSYTEELTRSDAAALKAEGSQYAQSGATWITRVLSFFDFGHYVKITRESLEDAEYIMQEVNDLLYNGLLRAIEALLYDGAGTTTIEGVYTAAKAFQKTVGVQGVSNASMRDILLAAKLQVKKGYNVGAENDTGKTGYNANLALISPQAAYDIETEKDEIGRPLVGSLAEFRPGGMAVVESEDCDADATTSEFVVGDFNKAMLYLKRNLIIETGYDGNDFTYGMITLRASARGNLLIKNLEKYAFTYGDFKTAAGLIAP